MTNTIRLNKTDSRFFKQNIVGWEVIKPLALDSVISKEKEIISEYEPAMITAFLPLNDITTIGHFSACNYQFIECRLLVEKELGNEQTTYNLYPYEFEQVTTRGQLTGLINACQEMTFDDRFFNDPLIDNQLALQRNIYFLEQSYRRPNEYIFILKNSIKNEICGFRSLRLNTPTEASMLITGIVKEKLNENIEEFINLFELEKLEEMNVRIVKAVISAQNHDEINRYIAKYNFNITGTKILFRKILKSLKQEIA